MTTKQARNLKPGDKVFAWNGPFRQNASVVSTEPHERQGLWITYTWASPSGRVRIGKKRHISVELQP